MVEWLVKKRRRWKLGEVTPRGYIFGVIVFVGLIMGGIGIMGEWNSVSPVFTSDDTFASFNDSFNRYEDVVSAGEGFESSVVDTNPDKGLFGVLDSLINVAWNSIRSVFTTFDFMNDVFKGLSSVFGVPSWVVGLISTLVIVMFAFSIYSLIFQGKV